MPIRSFFVRRSETGRPLVEVLRNHLSLPRPEAVRLLRDQRVRVAGRMYSDPHHRVHQGQRVQIRVDPGAATDRPGRPDRPAKAGPPRPRPAEGVLPPRVRYVDDHIVVVEKPAGLTTMRHPDEAAEFGTRAVKYLPATLADLLPAILADRDGAAGRPAKLAAVRAVHRLDKETSGLVVFARTAEAEGSLGKQFRKHTVERRYVAIVRGAAADAVIESRLVRDRGDGRRGSTTERGVGQRAVTHVKKLEDLNGFTLLECQLETGRTHQVRIHLGESGTPLCGERVYDRPIGGAPLPDDSGLGRVALHAASLGLVHPTTGKTMRWAAPMPADMAAFIAKQRRRRKPKQLEPAAVAEPPAGPDDSSAPARAPADVGPAAPAGEAATD